MTSVRPEDLIPLSKSDVLVGEPLQMSVYTRDGRLLLAEGQVIDTDRQLDRLIAEGLFFDGKWATATQPGLARRSTETPLSVRRRQSNVSSGDIAQALSLYVDGTPYVVRWIGCVRERSILVTAPRADGSLVFVKEGETYALRALHGGWIHRWQSLLIKSVFQPFPYLHLQWPVESLVSRRAFRSARRADVSLPCSVQILSSAAEPGGVTAMIYDLSTQGASLRIRSGLLVPQDMLSLAFRVMVDEEKVLFELSAQVMRVSDPLEDESQEIGIRFLDVPQPLRFALRAYVNEQLLKACDPPLFRVD